MSHSLRASLSIARILPSARGPQVAARPSRRALTGPGRLAIPRGKTLWLLAAVAVAIAAFVLWPTDRRRIERLVETARAAVVRGDWAAVAACVDDDVTAGARDKASLVDGWRSQWRAFALTTVDADVLDVSVSGDLAAAHVRVRPGAPATGSWADARVHFVRREAGWKIAGVDEITTGIGWLK